MSDRQKIISTLGLLFVVLLSACNPVNKKTTVPTQEPIILGYCPTMKPYVQSLVESGQSLSPVQFDNSVRTIQALNNGTIQAALIGRTARDHEVGEKILMVRLRDGYTLITQTQAAIPFNELPLVSIYTLEENRDALAILPPGTSITYYQDYDRMLAELDDTSAAMLRWSELPPTYQLLIPFNELGNKTPEFRSPHFYYDETSKLDFSQIINALSSVE